MNPPIGQSPKLLNLLSVTSSFGLDEGWGVNNMFLSSLISQRWDWDAERELVFLLVKSELYGGYTRNPYIRVTM